MWHPWFIEIDGKTDAFSFNDPSQKDLGKLVADFKIEVVKIYSKKEMNDEFDRIKFKLKK